MNYDPKQLEMGTEIEHEHTRDDALARKIAMDHLGEDPKYYTKLKAAGLEEDDMGMDGCCEPGAELSDVPSPTTFAAIAVSNMATAPAQQKLSSSGLGNGGTPKPLKSDNLEAPEKSVVKLHFDVNRIVHVFNHNNTVSTSKKTPLMHGQADAMDHFLGQASIDLGGQESGPMIGIHEGGAKIKKK